MKMGIGLLSALKLGVVFNETAKGFYLFLLAHFAPQARKGEDV